MPFSAVSLHTCIAGLYFFAKPLTTHGDFATEICKIETKFSYVVAKCDCIFSLISSPVGNKLQGMMGIPDFPEKSSQCRVENQQIQPT